MIVRVFCIMKLLLLALSICLLAHVSVAVLRPSNKLLVRAFCACECCRDPDEVCSQHKEVEELGESFKCSELEEYECNAEFCVELREAECRSACYCNQCKGKLAEHLRHKCSFRRQGVVPARCDCGDFPRESCTEVNRPENITSEQVGAELEVDKEAIAEAKKVAMERMRCFLPCFCKQCTLIDDKIMDKCEVIQATAGSSATEGCDCGEVRCPTSDDYDQIKEMKKKMAEQKLELDMKMDLAQAEANTYMVDDNAEAARNYNQEMEAWIAEGKVTPTSAKVVKLNKCKLQCVCNKCKALGSQPSAVPTSHITKSCETLVVTKGCPRCPSDVSCPHEENCKLSCTCSQCRDHESSNDEVRRVCDKFYDPFTSHCPCDEQTEEVDCEKIGKWLKKLDEKKTRRPRDEL